MVLHAASYDTRLILGATSGSGAVHPDREVGKISSSLGESREVDRGVFFEDMLCHLVLHRMPARARAGGQIRVLVDEWGDGRCRETSSDACLRARPFSQ